MGQSGVVTGSQLELFWELAYMILLLFNILGFEMCDASIDWLLVAGTEKNDVKTTTLQAKITKNNFFFIITRFLS
jgi:hypothetical protein